MNDSTTFDTVGDEPIEVRIVAWVLGEASAFEAAELERLCDERPELLVFRRRMLALHGLLTEAETQQADDAWKLPAEKRQALDEIFGVQSAVIDLQKEKRIGSSARRTFLAIAACLLLTAVVAGLTAPIAMRQRKKAEGRSVSFAASNENRDFTVPSGGGGAERLNNKKRELGTHGGPLVTKALEPPQLPPAQRGKTFGIVVPESAADTASAGERAAGTAAADSTLAFQQPLAKSAPEPAMAPAAVDEEVRYKVDAADRARSSQEVAKQERFAKREVPAGPAAAMATPATPPLPASEAAAPELPAIAGSGIAPGLGGRGFGGGGGGAFGPDAAPPPVTAAPRANKPMPARRQTAQGQAGIAAAAKPPVDYEVQEQLAASDMDMAARAPSEAKPSEAYFFRRSKDAVQPNQPMGGNAAGDGLQSLTGLFGRRGVEDESFRREASAKPAEMFDSDGEAAPPVLAAKSSTAAPANGPIGAVGGALVDGPHAFAGKVMNGDLGIEPSEMPKELADNAALGGLRRNLSDEFSLDEKGQKNNESDLGRVDGSKMAGSKAGGQAGADFISPVNGAEDHFAENSITAGNRSGDTAINRTSIDAILNNPNRVSDMPSLSDRKEGTKSDADDASIATRDKSAGEPSLSDRNQINSEAISPRVFRVPPDFLATLEGGGGDSDGAAADPFAPTDGESQAAKLKARPPIIDLLKRNGINFPEGSSVALSPSGGLLISNTPAELDKVEQLMGVIGSEKKLSESTLLSDPQPPATPAKPAPPEVTEEISTNDNPYSTFSLNISDASFRTAEAALAKGERPDPVDIKPEQFYNAVDYGDPAPANNEPVAATIEQAANPVIPNRTLVRVALRTGATGHSANQPLHLTLLVDQSGSMVREDRRAAMEQALKQLGGLMTANDSVSVIGFSRVPRLLADGLPGDQAGQLNNLVNQTASEGGTNLEEAMKIGAQIAQRHRADGAQNRIVLFTDGAANLGNADPEKLAQQVNALRQGGIAFDIAGIGADGLNDRLLGELARHGNGRYYVVGDAKDNNFARQLAGAFRPAAENVKVQVNFNPQRVSKYKLIGFEKDRLKTEDFRNDAVDAAEMAAEEAGVAIYQVETLPEGTGEIGEVSVRFRDTSNSEMVERSWTMAYDSASVAFDRATPSMQLAGLATFAAEKLRGGPLGDAIDFKLLAGSRAAVKQYYNGNERVAALLRMIDAL